MRTPDIATIVTLSFNTTTYISLCQDEDQVLADPNGIYRRRIHRGFGTSVVSDQTRESSVSTGILLPQWLPKGDQLCNQKCKGGNVP